MKMKRKIKIEESEVREIIKMKDDIKTHEGRAAFIKDKLVEKELKLYNDLEAGAETGHLPWDLIPKVQERRFPSWKAWFVHFMGEKKAETILNKTKPVKYYHVSIKKKVQILD
jgi:hypothetical protein